jgi:hypothetical protein
MTMKQINPDMLSTVIGGASNKLTFEALSVAANSGVDGFSSKRVGAFGTEARYTSAGKSLVCRESSNGPSKVSYSCRTIKSPAR